MVSLAARLDGTTGVTRTGHAEYLCLLQEMNDAIIVLTMEKRILPTQITLTCNEDFTNPIL